MLSVSKADMTCPCEDVEVVDSPLLGWRAILYTPCKGDGFKVGLSGSVGEGVAVFWGVGLEVGFMDEMGLVVSVCVGVTLGDAVMEG